MPEERSFSPMEASPYHHGPLYSGRFFLFRHAAHALGVARAAIDSLVELANRKQRLENCRRHSVYMATFTFGRDPGSAPMILASNRGETLK